MKYYDFICKTISNKNNIDWNYYGNHIDTDNILQGNASNTFIKLYFENGEKTFPLLLNPETADRFIENYFIAGQKESALSFRFDGLYRLPDDRAVHTISGFFLGLLIENCINNTNTFFLKSSNRFPFAYFWFLTFLYHDYGYCVTERENSPIQLPQNAYIPNRKNAYYKYCTVSECWALKEVKKQLGIDLSPFSQLGAFHSEHRDTPNLEHALLMELTQRNNTISGHPKLQFSNGSKIHGHQYPSNIITRYMNYCINERHRVDHGIVGGYLFYDRMIKNYMIAYITSLKKGHQKLDLSDFYYRGRHFCREQLTIFSYISDCILSHNIFKQAPNKRYLYEKYRLYDLLEENFKTVTFETNPLLYILAVSDTLEPIKAYRQNSNLSAQEIAEAIDIDYTPGARALSFSSKSNTVDINLLYQKAKDLMDWTSVQCSDLTNGSFTLRI